MNKSRGILLDESGDIAIDDNGIVVGDVTNQNTYMILVANQGEIKEHPLLGVGINDMINDEDELSWKRRIIEGLLKDDLKTDEIVFKEGGEINIKTHY